MLSNEPNVQECDPSRSFPIKSGRTLLLISEENDKRSDASKA